MYWFYKALHSKQKRSLDCGKDTCSMNWSKKKGPLKLIFYLLISLVPVLRSNRKNGKIMIALKQKCTYCLTLKIMQHFEILKMVKNLTCNIAAFGKDSTIIISPILGNYEHEYVTHQAIIGLYVWGKMGHQFSDRLWLRLKKFVNLLV